MEFDAALFAWTLASFAIVLFVLYKFVFPPVLKFLDEREEMQKKFQAQLEADTQEAEKIRKKYEQQLEGLQGEIENRLKSLDKEINEQRRQAFEQLDLDRKHALSQLEKEVTAAKHGALSDMSGKLEDIVFSAITKIFQRKLTLQDHEDIIEDCIKEMETKIAENL